MPRLLHDLCGPSTPSVPPGQVQAGLSGQAHNGPDTRGVASTQAEEPESLPSLPQAYVKVLIPAQRHLDLHPVHPVGVGLCGSSLAFRAQTPSHAQPGLRPLKASLLTFSSGWECRSELPCPASLNLVFQNNFRVVGTGRAIRKGLALPHLPLLVEPGRLTGQEGECSAAGERIKVQETKTNRPERAALALYTCQSFHKSPVLTHVCDTSPLLHVGPGRSMHRGLHVALTPCFLKKKKRWYQ